MSIAIDLDRNRNPALYDKVKFANAILLDDILDPSTDQLEGRWDEFRDERGRLTIRLELSDPMGNSHQENFATDEFDSVDHLWFRLRRFWTKLLRQRFREGMRQLDEQLKSLVKE